jgi:LacI family transcriptional regulator
MNSVNLKHLATELNISEASVSRALRGSYEISSATKERVWAMAAKMHYEPNPFATSLIQPKSKTIAVLIPEITDHFFAAAIDGIEAIARANDFHMLIYQTHQKSEIELSFIKSLLNGRVEGILISVSGDSSLSDYFAALSKKIPVVFFDRVYDNNNTITVTTNDYESAFNATQHLLESRCKQILCCLGSANMSTIGKKRLAGYSEALRLNGVPFDDNLIMTARHDEGNIVDQIKNKISEFNIDGIFSSIEEFSLPCYEACRQLNLRIPHDVKIISFSNADSAPLLKPSLTTVAQPAFEIGKQAAIILFKVLDKTDHVVEFSYELKSTIVKRESTAF